MSPTVDKSQQIFIQLGRLPKYGRYSLKHAKLVNSSLRTILISDRVLSPYIEGVECVPVSSVVSKREFDQLRVSLAASGFDPRWRNGYWFKIFGRFLILRNYTTKQPNHVAGMHLECDVASFVSEGIFQSTLDRMKAPTALPFIDSNTACPGIVIARSMKDLAALSDHVVQEVHNRSGLSDMQSLAGAATIGLTEQLPTTTQMDSTNVDVTMLDISLKSRVRESAQIVFDAAAVGQYLFGIDPRNNRGVITPGYRETRGGVDPGLWTDWTFCKTADGIIRIAFRDDLRLGVLANLHVHAKIVLPKIVPDDPQWSRWLSIANQRSGAHSTVIKKEYFQYEIEELVRRLRRLARRFERRIRRST